MTDKTPLEYLSEMQDLVDLCDFVNDDNLAEAMGLIVKLLAQPAVKARTAADLVVRMQAFSALFKLRAQTYMTIHTGKAGTDENKKKNIYFAASDVCDKMASAIKYLVKENS